MRRATREDIAMELWLRERGDRELRWITKDGKEIPIRDMSIDHLRNILNITSEQSPLELMLDFE
jgi:hypothetical protein